jgi:hypothetical protein
LAGVYGIRDDLKEKKCKKGGRGRDRDEHKRKRAQGTLK